MYGCGTQLKVRVRLQRQTDKAAKLILVSQKQAYIKASTHYAASGIAGPILAEDIAKSTDLPMRSSIKEKVFNHE